MERDLYMALLDALDDFFMVDVACLKNGQQRLIRVFTIGLYCAFIAELEEWVPLVAVAWGTT